MPGSGVILGKGRFVVGPVRYVHDTGLMAGIHTWVWGSVSSVCKQNKFVKWEVLHWDPVVASCCYLVQATQEMLIFL